MRCFLCQKNNFQIIYDLKSRIILKCKNDGLFLVQDDKEKIQYDENYYKESPYPIKSDLNNDYFQNKLEKLVSLVGRNDFNLLDIGCGWGNFLEVVKKNSIPYLGIDSSKAAIKICKSKGLNCKNVSINQLIETGKKFSCITCFQVLEHIKNPLSFLISLKKLIKPGGVLLLTTPNNDSPLRRLLKTKWPVYNTKSHFVFYNKKTLEKTFTMAGYKNISVKIDSPRFMSFNYIISRIFHREFKFLENISLPTDPFGDLEAIIKL